jgi:hypothetical protein
MRLHCALIALSAALAWVPTAGRAQSDRLIYAEKCAKEMGAIPKFNCLNGELLPVTQDGTEQETTVDTCDRPPQLGLLKNGKQCVPFSRVQILEMENKNVIAIALCRKYFDRPETRPAGNQPGIKPHQNKMFDDIAIIQHDRATGRTCFFQTETSDASTDSGRDGSEVLSPSDPSPRAEAFWLPPQRVGGDFQCTSCHAADPFVWSPYIVQAPKIARAVDTDQWNPIGRYDSNFANLFGRPATIFGPAGNTCMRCHRFGRGPNPDPKKSEACNFFVHRYVDPGKAHVTRSKANEFWMPPEDAKRNPDDWNREFKAAVEQIDRCCADPERLECLPDVADGRFPRTEAAEVLRGTGAACSETACLGWLPLDNNRTTRALAASDATLYQLRENGVILRSTGAPCKSTFCEDGWTPLDRNPLTIAIAAGAGVLHQLRGDGTIWRFTGTACKLACPGWVQLSAEAKTVAIAMGGIGLQRLDHDGAVWRFVGPACGKKGCTGWQQLDNNPDTVAIAAAPEAIYQLHRSGMIRRYTGKPCNANGCNGWQMVDNNPATIAIAAAGSQLYQLHDSGALWRFNGIACNADGCPGWRLLDNNPKTVAIAAAGSNLYQMHDDGAVWRFTGRPCDAEACNGWTRLDSNDRTTKIVAGGDRLYQLRQDRGTDRRAELRQRPFGMAATQPR